VTVIPTPSPAPTVPDASAPSNSVETLAVEEVLRRYGHGALLPFQLGSDKHRTQAPGGAVIVFGRYGRYRIAIGDPIGPPGSETVAWAAFIARRRARHETAAVYQASHGSRDDLIALGLRPFCVGHEAIVDLATFDLTGSRRANLRHTVTRARKGHVSFRFYRAGIPASDLGSLVGPLTELDHRWSSDAGPRLGFTIGVFDPAELDRLAIAIATDAQGTPIAFTTYRSTGVDGGWVLDLLRRDPGGPPGALEGSIAEAASGLRGAGASTLSLGLAPLARIGEESAPVEERILARLGSMVRPLYDVRGLAFFKGKFDPRWEPRYIGTARRRDLPGLVVALVGLHVGGYRSVVFCSLRGTSSAARGWVRHVETADRPATDR
jgi:phosphatidylglycerol lysyltransferase